MADANGRQPGDPFYDPNSETDPSGARATSPYYDVSGAGTYAGSQPPPGAPSNPYNPGQPTGGGTNPYANVNVSDTGYVSPKATTQVQPSKQAVYLDDNGEPKGGAQSGGGVDTPYGRLSAEDKAQIDQMLANAQSTDDPSYWYGIAAQHGGVASTGVDWLTGRINQGDGALGVRNGTVQKFQDSGGVNQSVSIDPFTDQFSNPAFTAPTGVDEQNDPGYEARLKMGTDALQHSAAAKGSILSGQTLSDLNDYAQNYASNEYGNVYNRALQNYQTNSANNFNQYSQKYKQYLDAANQTLAITGANNNAAQSNWMNAFNQSQQNFNYNQQNWLNQYNVANLGLNAANDAAANGANYGNNAGNTITGIGNAQAAGTVGQGNALQNSLGYLTNYATGAITNRYGGSGYQGYGTPGFPGDGYSGVNHP